MKQMIFRECADYLDTQAIEPHRRTMFCVCEFLVRIVGANAIQHTSMQFIVTLEEEQCVRSCTNDFAHRLPRHFEGIPEALLGNDR